jgi:hypothetical protein
MKIHLFQSTGELDVFGFTSDETGANLPVDLAPWTRAGENCAVETGPGIVARAGEALPIQWLQPLGAAASISPAVKPSVAEPAYRG